jgi:WW domain-binding protein 4
LTRLVSKQAPAGVNATAQHFTALHSTLPMSEYWVSKKRHFCKYCDVYIADDVPSRQHHENGLRHKGNVERFVRGLYKAGEKRKKDAEEEKREMMKIERVRFYSFFLTTFI